MKILKIRLKNNDEKDEPAMDKDFEMNLCCLLWKTQKMALAIDKCMQ